MILYNGRFYSSGKTTIVLCLENAMFYTLQIVQISFSLSKANTLTEYKSLTFHRSAKSFFNFPKFHLGEEN